jgi:hypothetical protein
MLLRDLVEVLERCVEVEVVEVVVTLADERVEIERVRMSVCRLGCGGERKGWETKD